jgi:AraC-like DNA-binding protein
VDNKVNIIHGDYLDIWNNESNEGPGVDFRSHIHPEYEIIYVFSGDVDFFLDGYKYPFLSESLFLTPPNAFHGWKLRSPRLYHRASILFAPELFEPAEQSCFLNLFIPGPRFFPNTSSRNINFYIRALLECKDMEQPLRRLALKSRLVSLLSEISLLNSSHARVPASGDTRALQVLEYLAEHLREELTLEDVAGRFNISKNYLNILFRQATGTTVNQYIRIKRLALARREILKGVKAQEAAYYAGFNDYPNFYRAYKAFYGSLPSAPNRSSGRRAVHLR